VEAVQAAIGAGGMAFGSGATIDNWVAIGAALPPIAILNREPHRRLTRRPRSGKPRHVDTRQLLSLQHLVAL
jgi:hypothetical protein